MAIQQRGDRRIVRMDDFNYKGTYTIQYWSRLAAIANGFLVSKICGTLSSPGGSGCRSGHLGCARLELSLGLCSCPISYHAQH